MRRTDILRRLEERLARGEISEKTYLEIKARYEAEPEEVPEESAEVSLGEAIARITTEATRMAGAAAEEAIRAVDFSGMGVRLSDEAIKIAGSGVVSGNPVRTRMFKAAGSARVQGNLEADEAKVAGACSIEGDCRSKEFRSSGSTKIAGSLRADEVEASGSLQVEKDIEAKEFVASGRLDVGGNVRAEEFRASGSVRIQGELTAEEVDIELGGSSNITTIRAQEIDVKATGGFWRGRGDLTSRRIEGQEVTLEATEADFVKGQEVHIGPHCRIGVVEAQELIVHESSEVKERRVLSA